MHPTSHIATSVLQGLTEALQSQQDTAADSTPAAAEVIESVGNEVREVGELALAGEWSRLGERIVTGASELAVSFIPNLLSALFVGVAFYAVYRVVLAVAERTLDRSGRVSAGLQSLTLRAARLLGLGFVAIMVVSQLGVNIGALIAGLGIVGIALGFAAQDSLANFISGVTILLDKPFSVGDLIEVEGVYGEVREITLRSTRVRTVDNRIMVMPNLLMINQQLINHSKAPSIRVDIPFGIAYKEDPREARDVVLELVSDDQRLDPRKEAEVVVTELASSSVDMELRFHILNPALERPIRVEYTEKIRLALGDAGIEIPFPHLQLFIDGAKALEDLPSGVAAGGVEEDRRAVAN